MRTLTLGVLIVSGGTLAALPFRRYQAIPDASNAPVQVTGPSHSALDPPRRDDSSDAIVRERPDATKLRGSVLAGHLPVWQPPSALPPRPRQLDIPLTYDDLAVPIDQPKPIQDRFNATAAVRQKQVERERVASLEMPPMETLVASQQEELKRVMKSVAESELRQDVRRRSVGGSLASVSSQSLHDPSSNAGLSNPPASMRAGPNGYALNPETESLPAANSQSAERHWIRQPD